MSLFRLDTGIIPVITNESMLHSAGFHGSEEHIILQTVITTLVFLVIILWFTLVFNISTRGQMDTDYNFLQFAIYFTLFAIIMIYFLLAYKSAIC